MTSVSFPYKQNLYLNLPSSRFCIVNNNKRRFLINTKSLLRLHLFENVLQESFERIAAPKILVDKYSLSLFR